MKRLGPCLLVSLLTACAGLMPQPDAGGRSGAESAVEAAPTHDAQSGRSRAGDANASGSRAAAPDHVGRVGPNGTPPPGMPQTAAVQVALPSIADRGIGGTGAPLSPAAGLQTADRGIGGTGIVGVVTGFGSIFVDGIEVEYDAAAAVEIDGSAAPVSALRAGQLVAIQADGPASAPHARTIAVRSVAIGRIEALELGSGMLTIAGQPVTVPDGTWGANGFRLGDWAKVSGLRRLDGTIVASRLDPAPPGVLQVRGQVVRDGAEARVGNLVLTEQAAAGLKDGEFVVLSGDYATGSGHVRSVASDPLPANPAAYFGPATNRLVLQAFVRVTQGSVSINGLTIRSAPAIGDHAGQDGIAIVSLQRQADGAYTVVDLHYADFQGHTWQPGRSSPGDAAQAPQKNAHAGAGSAPPAAASDSGPATAGAVATAAIAAGTYNTGGATLRTDDAGKGVAVTSVAPAAGPVITQPDPPAHHVSPSVVAAPLVTTPAETTPAVASATPAPAPAVASATPAAAPDATLNPGTPETPSAVKAVLPAGAPTQEPPFAGGPATPGGSTPGGASVRSVPPTDQLISSLGSGSTSGTAALISSNTGAPKGAWQQPRVAAALAQRAPRHSSTVIGTTISPGITQLTAAVTTEAATASVPGAATAALSAPKPRSASAVAGRAVAPPATLTGRAATATRSH